MINPLRRVFLRLDSGIIREDGIPTVGTCRVWLYERHINGARMVARIMLAQTAQSMAT